MTRRTLPLAALLFLILAGWRSDAPTRFGFTDTSTLWVTGTSTIHDWRCDVEQVDGWLDARVGQGLTGITGTVVTVKADGLECKNGTMDKKARNALDADAHPTIRYELTTAELQPGTADGFQVRATGQLTIAGTSRSVTTTVQGRSTDEGRVRLTGSVPVTMSDYGIDPPKAMLGALKTGDLVTVHFDVLVAPTVGS